MEKRKNKGKKIVLLVCGILLALAVIAGGAAAVLFMNNGSTSEEAEYSGEVHIQDEQALRAALKSEDDCQIVLSEDIVITKELEVFGDKKLSGGSIIMDMHREGSGESVLAIQKGAKLVLDGTTVDGNSVVNCISVKAGGELDSQSGSLVYGYPYGLDVAGKATITDILIDETLHTGVNVSIFGEVDMLGGTISQNVYGIAVAEEARMDIADGVTMTKSVASFIVNYGVMDIRGGKYEGSYDNAIENWGTMDIRGTAEKTIEISNGTKSAINSKNNAKLTAEHINIYDMGWHGMCVEKNAKATLKNISFDTTGKSTLYVNSAKATIENISIVNGVSYGVYGTKNADVTMTNVTIKDMGHRAVVNEMSILTADGLVIENSVQHGVYTTGDSAVTTVNNATITGTERGAFTVAKGKGTITNSHIADTKRECVSIAEPGTAIIEDCTIDNAGNFGIGCYGGVANVKNTTFTNSGNASVLVQDNGTVTCDGLTVKNSAKQAVRAEKGGIAKITNCNIDTTGAASVYANGGKITLKSAVINNAKTYGVAAKDCKKANGQILQLENVTVNNPGEHGIGSLNGYMVATNITVNNPKRCGVYSEGAESIINMNEIEVNKAGSCGLGFKGAAEITARNVTINSPKNEGVYAFKGANVKNLDNITIKDPGTHGISVEGGAVVHVTVNTKFNPDNKKGNGVTVLNPGKNGIRVKEATLTAKNVTVKNAGGQGISANTESDVTVNGCTIDTTVQAAVYAGESKLTLKNATIDNAGSYAVAAQNGTKEKEQMVQLTDVEINKTGGHAIGSLNGYIVATNIKVTDPKRCGVYSEGAEAIINMNQVKVYNTGSCGFGFKGAKEITARNVLIDQPNNEGIYAFNGANVKQLDNITIKNPGSHGISVEGNAIVNVTVDTKFNPDNKKENGVTILNPGKVGIRCSNGTVTAKGATIKNAGAQGISANKESSVIVNGCTIDTTVQGGVYAEGSSMSLKNAAITSAGTYGVATKNSGKILLDNVEINKSGEHGIGSLNGYIVATNVKVNEPKRSGVYSEGAEAIINMNQVEVHNAGSCGFGFKGAKEITARNVTIEKPKNEGIYAFEGANVKKLDNITVKNPGSHGISVEGNATVNIIADTSFNPENTTGNGVTIVNAETHGIRVKGATLTAAGANITDAKLHGVYGEADAKITLKKSAIASPGRNGIAVLESATADVSETTVTNAGERGLYNEGKLTLTSAEAGQIALTIDTTADHGIYLGANANVEGSGLTIKNTGNNGIFSEGADMNISNFNLENTAEQGVQFKNGTVALSNINFKEAGKATVYVRNNTKLTLTGGTIAAYSYGVATTDNAEVTVKNVTIEKSTKDETYSTNALINAEKNSTVDLQSGTKLDGKGKTGDGVNVVTSTTSVILNGATFANIAQGNAAVNLKGSNTTVKLQKALTESVSLKPSAYTNGLLVAEKTTEISDADFEASMTLLVPVNTDWIVNGAGRLSKPGDAVAAIGNTTYTSLEEAVAAANESAGADVITVLKSNTVKSQLKITGDVTITASQAITVTADFANSLFNITSGTVAITGASESAKITFASGVKTTNIVYNNGGTVSLTNVELAGNVSSTAGNNSTYGIYNNAGHITAKSVTIHDIPKGDGINIRAGASADLDNVTILNTSRYGLKTFGTVNIYNTVRTDKALFISNTADHAMDIDNGGKVISGLASVPAGTYAITIDTTTKNTARGIMVRGGAELAITDVSIENAKLYGVDLYAASSVASISNAAIASESYGINAVANSSLTLGNVLATGNPADINLAKGAKLKLNKALTQNITVQLGEYAEDVVVAEKTGEITDTDFAASMALLVPVDVNWYVDSTGKLVKTVCEHSWSEEITTQPTCTAAGVKTYTCSKCGNTYTEPVDKLPHTISYVAALMPTVEAAGNIEYWYCTVCGTAWEDPAHTKIISLDSVTLPKLEEGTVAYMNGQAFQTLEDAVKKANETAAADTIYLLSDVTVSAQLNITTDMTITASKAVTISIDSALSVYPFNVASGKSLTVRGTASDRITVASTSTSKEVFYNQGILELTNVSVSGGKYAVNNRADTLKLTNVTITGTADNGLHLAGGTTTVTNVTIYSVKGHGIGCYADLVLQPEVAGEIALTIKTTGTSSAKKHGIYASYNASITGSGLSIQNPTNAGFFGDYDASKSTVGVTVNLTNVTVTNTGAQGIQVKKGTVTISNFTITGTGSAALRPYDSKGAVTFNLSNGTVTTGSYGLYMDKSTHSTVLNNVIFERTGIETDVVLSAANSATLTATNVTVNIPSVFTALSINGAASYEGITVITE